jgi:hypothetical protein
VPDGLPGPDDERSARRRLLHRAVQPATFLEPGALAGAVSFAWLRARLVLLERGIAVLLMAAPVASGDLAARFMSLRPHGRTRASYLASGGAEPRTPFAPAASERSTAMFDGLTDETLRAAQDAARLLYDNHRALGLDPAAIKLDTLRVDIAVELENRAEQPVNHQPRKSLHG